MVEQSGRVDERLAILGNVDRGRGAQLARAPTSRTTRSATCWRASTRISRRVSHEDAAAAHAAYDRIEARLVELQPFLACCRAEARRQAAATI